MNAGTTKIGTGSLVQEITVASRRRQQAAADMRLATASQQDRQFRKAACHRLTTSSPEQAMRGKLETWLVSQSGPLQNSSVDIIDRATLSFSYHEPVNPASGTMFLSNSTAHLTQSLFSPFELKDWEIYMHWFTDLPRPGAYPRIFLPVDINLQSWLALEEYFRELEYRLLSSPEDLWVWMRDRDELFACGREELQRLMGRVEIDTRDQEAQSKLQQFKQDVWEPALAAFARLAGKFLACPLKDDLDQSRFRSYTSQREAEVERSKVEFKTVGKADDDFKARWARLDHDSAVYFEGQAASPASLQALQHSPDRALRERAFRTFAERRAEDMPARDLLTGETIIAQAVAARDAGYDPYLRYVLKREEWQSTEPHHLSDVHESVARHAVPILHKIDRRRAKNLGLERLRPWDVEVGNAFIDSRSLATPQMHSAMGRTIAAALDPELGSMLDAMDRDGLLSLGTYPGKQQIRHSNCLTELRKPRIFINSDESDLGLFVLLHETGHAANAWFARQNEWFDDRQGTTTDIDEFPSNALCLLAMDKLDLVMPPLQAQAMIRWELESLIGWVVGWAKTDASMCWLYAHPQADPEERASAQAAISLRYGHDADWTGLEHFRGSFHTPSPVSWSGPSIYLAPYMMVLRLYGEYLKNPHGTYAAYKRCLSLGGSMSAPMLYAEAGLTFDFSPKVMGPVFATIDRMLE